MNSCLGEAILPTNLLSLSSREIEADTEATDTERFLSAPSPFSLSSKSATPLPCRYLHHSYPSVESLPRVEPV